MQDVGSFALPQGSGERGTPGIGRVAHPGLADELVGGAAAAGRRRRGIDGYGLRPSGHRYLGSHRKLKVNDKARQGSRVPATGHGINK